MSVGNFILSHGNRTPLYNLVEIKPYEEQAIDLVVSILNKAKEEIGIYQNLWQLARSRNELSSKWKVSLQTLRRPLMHNCEKLIASTIEKQWHLTPTLKYKIRFMGNSQDESSHYYYFEVIFSQPTASYPIPQATVSVFFRVEDKHIEPPEIKGVPMMHFRIEGHHTDHDVRFVMLPLDWILATLKMKINIYKRIEAIRLF